ncbi:MULTISPECIES: sensor histidine kinase [unclassified Streptomyces]|uniref:sensor histidine kinase n=1 Tax=unclassified Streptomyces TaxID=2593676 RepID=UPI002DDA986E|nr:sensor domain-containing protein [Streptomyces sp. NBC_01766]WSC22648.1 sensor domain-containing protein [Streptomyces sp. NBC_01766]
MQQRPRAVLYAVLALPIALLGMVLVLSGLLVGAALSVTAVGPWLIALTARGALAIGTLQRGLSARLLDTPIDPPVRSRQPGALGWRRAVLGDRAAWRAVGCALAAPLTAVPPLAAVACGYVYGLLFVLHPLVERWNYTTVHRPDGSVRRVSLEVAGVQFDSWPRWLLVVAVGAVLLLLAPWLVRRSLVPHGRLLGSLLGPDAAGQRIRTLEETRAQAVDDAAATLRRIERDLHDGTQARLVGLGMHLTLIGELVTADAGRDQLLTVVGTAQTHAKQTIAELRLLVKGIHPPVLDQGLDTALATLAADSALPVTVTADIPERPSPALESIAYFCTAELLTNAAKHSGASEITVVARSGEGSLRLSVRDDGRGGAVVGAGSGLAGLLARVRTVDGTLTCESPAGGPTVVTVELPYHQGLSEAGQRQGPCASS